MKTGKVWLVGSGPGDCNLLTIKAKHLIETADVIVYDRLVGFEILSMIPSKIEKINVGKRSNHHAVPQEEINRILVREAKKGKKVVRLKGGDPFLFGRGGEEIEELLKEEVPFEVVPGISSSIAVPAYHGIPVTHRDYVSSVHIITGHKKPGSDRNIDYEALVRAGGTLVFLMGVQTLAEIMEHLREAGMDETMPAAILQQGTRFTQKRVVSTIKELPRKAKEENIQAPSVIVVGEVCKLANDFRWFEKLPLFGESIMISRPKQRAENLKQRLKDLGAQILEIPTIQTVPIKGREQKEEIVKTLEEIANYDILAFTSPYGVERFFDLLFERGKDSRCLAHLKFAVIGSGTKKALKKYGILADFMPEHYDGISFGNLLATKCEAGTKILLARSSIGSKEALEELDKNKSLIYKDLAIYDTIYDEDKSTFLKKSIEQNQITKVIFTSSSTVLGFCEMLKLDSYERIHAVCIGEKTKNTAEKMGMKTLVAKNATEEELIACLLASKN